MLVFYLLILIIDHELYLEMPLVVIIFGFGLGVFSIFITWLINKRQT